MEGTPIDIVIFAPLAPILGVILFWFIKLLFIESQKYFLDKIRPKHEALCRFTNFLGILFQTICHALGYTVTKSGISDVYISVNYGRVAPKKEKKGIFEWISNAFLFIGPFFIPAFLLLVCSIFLIPDVFQITVPADIINIKYTFGGQLIAFGTNLFVFSEKLLGFLFSINLLHPGHFGFFLLLIFLGMGIRPSYIGEKKIDRVDLIYDLRNVWKLIRNKPVYILLLFLLAYDFFYISLLLGQNWYAILFSIFGFLTIISIFAIIIAHLIIFLIRAVDKIEGKKKYLPYITPILSYILMRILFFYFPNKYTNTISLFVMLVATFLVSLLLLRKGDTFKTGLNIKWRKKKSEDKKDGE